MFSPILIVFTLSFCNYSFEDFIQNSRFDLSYLTIVFTFLIIFIVDNRINKSYV